MSRQKITLKTIPDYVLSDPGLRASIPSSEIEGGAEGARMMNAVIGSAIKATGVNTDRQISPDDAREISDHIRSDPRLYDRFIKGHGDDEGRIETGYHLVQGDGGTYKFQGRNFVNTVADAIYHIGFEYENGRFLNEDGNANEAVDDIAGWLNYFVNGVNAVYGTNKNDRLTTGDYSNDLSAAADETFFAGDGNDTVWTGDGDDTVHSGSGHDSTGGGDGNDVLLGEGGNDSLWGADGDDRLVGGKGNDDIGGGEGNDTLLGGDGDDTLNGGDGDDRISARSGNDHLWGGDGADTMHGGHGADTIGGGQGDDDINGGSGADTLDGGDGHDTLSGRGGEDSLWGGDGDDFLLGGHGNDTIGGGRGHDTLEGGQGNDSFWGAEGDDVMRGGQGRDDMGGGGGDDLISGGAGHDELNGHDGADTLEGGSGRDTLWGGAGQDVFDGGIGADVLRGWEGGTTRDVFVFRPGESGVTRNTRDVIEGFQEGTDKIDLSAFGPLAFIAAAAFSGDAAEVRFHDDLLEIDSNADGKRDATIKVSYASDLDAGDLILA